MMTNITARRVAPIDLPNVGAFPLISVLMANKNYARFIGLAIESMLSQTYQNWELVICDDGSDDDSVAVARSFVDRDPRVKVVERVESGGMAAALNAAYARSSGSIICFLDSDDTCDPTRIEKIANEMHRNPKAGILSHPLRMVDRDGIPIGLMPFRTRTENGWIGERVLARGGRWGNMPGGGTVVRREVADHVFPIPEEQFRRSADAFLYTLAPLLAEVSTIAEPLYNYRIHGANDMQRMLRDESVSRDEIRSIENTTSAVNRQLDELGYPGSARLETAHNLNYCQHLFLLGLFTGALRTTLIGEYVQIARMLASDDLYHLHERVVRMIIYGVAVPLPMALRRHWLLLSRAPRRGLSQMRKWIQRPLGKRREDDDTTVAVEV